MVVTTTSTSDQHLKDDGEETDPIRLYFQSSISQQCAYVCSRRTSSLSPPMCWHPCYQLLRCRAVITKNMSRKKHSSFLTGTTEWYYWSFLQSHSSRCSSFCSLIARPLFRKNFCLFPWNTKSITATQVFEILLPCPCHNGLFIFVPSIVSISFLFTFKYTALVFFAFSDSPTLPHSISTLRKSCLACLISSDRRTMSSAKSRSVNRWLESYDSVSSEE